MIRIFFSQGNTTVESNEQMIGSYLSRIESPYYRNQHSAFLFISIYLDTTKSSVGGGRHY
jgi:hypothetical protein